MADNTDKESNNKLGLSGGKGTLSLKAPVGAGAARRNVATGRSARPVAVEVKKKRGIEAQTAKSRADEAHADLHLTDSEREARTRALQQAQQNPKETSTTPYQSSIVVKKRGVDEEETKSSGPALPADSTREQEMARLRQISESDRGRRKNPAEVDARKHAPNPTSIIAPPADKKPTGRKVDFYGRTVPDNSDDAAGALKKRPGTRANEPRRRNSGKLTVHQIINNGTLLGEQDGRTPSMAAQRRARERMRAKQAAASQEKIKQFREVIIPEVITVQELANRMTERVGDVVKKLMGMGIMATGNQNIDADTAELIVHEFGHTVKRVLESDVELGTHRAEDKEESLRERPPVVTIMGHVDHGKTSLLDAIRSADVAAHEAGGITQHIGAYQIQTKGGKKITFIDTPGHAAFTEMRARGADVTDIVILVVAADDSVMPQTIEAISHAKAAGKPMIIAINKCDLPGANPDKVRQQLLQHEVVVEQMGGDSQCIEVSAKTKKGLEELEEAILLQAEVLRLRSNPTRTAIGAVVEARLEQGKGSVATVLVQKGTLKPGDVFVAGTETGRVRALVNDRGQQVKEAFPGQPIEVLGLTGTPEAGDDFTVVEDDAKAREIAEFRLRKKRALHAAKTKGVRPLDQMISEIQAGVAKNLPVLIKGDVHGSVEAIVGALNKLTEDNKEVKVQILHSGVGAITESDITLANASKAMVIGFNVRANPQARDLAKRDGVQINYYSIIYEVIDDVKGLLGGLLSPSIKEKFIGYAEIRKVFNISKTGKIAGCFVTEGLVKRGAKVRLLRDNVVIHEGTLKTLRRFKDEAREVQKGYECGMAFENYDDIKEGDIIEAFEMESTERQLA
ncbi:MAG: translation initiation factor IF-2 [Proteobacteria bacterium]|nr:translation initiation factor IF-2 [Pseudomonadota bacterium]